MSTTTTPNTPLTPLVIPMGPQLIVENREKFKQRILDELDAGVRRFVLDFSDTGYVDASGCGVLVSVKKAIRERGGELVLAGLNEDLRTLFDLTKMSTMFTIADKVDRAVYLLRLEEQP